MRVRIKGISYEITSVDRSNPLVTMIDVRPINKWQIIRQRIYRLFAILLYDDLDD